MGQIFLPPARPNIAEVTVPGDKSISHRALMFASLARGTSDIHNLNPGADVDSTFAALRALGVNVSIEGRSAHVTGVEEFRDPPSTLDCGNSGTTMRLLTGLGAGRVDAVLDGDMSLRRRPMERVAVPLRTMGADIVTGADGFPPVRLRRGAHALRGIRYEMPHASAQVKSAMLLAALRAEGPTTVVEPQKSRDHSELMLRAMGAAIEVDGPSIRIAPSKLQPLVSLEIPGDFSAAFFFIAAAASVTGSRLVIRNVGINPTRVAALDVAKEMGVDVLISNVGTSSNEAVADLEVRGGALLRGVRVRADVVAILIDEIPALCALAATATGAFVVRGASELRVKESDRIASVGVLLRSFGVDVTELDDGIIVRGGCPLLPRASIDACGDHRIGMSGAILAAAARSSLAIDGAECVSTSFPEFEHQWQRAFG